MKRYGSNIRFAFVGRFVGVHEYVVRLFGWECDLRGLVRCPVDRWNSMSALVCPRLWQLHLRDIIEKETHALTPQDVKRCLTNFVTD